MNCSKLLFLTVLLCWNPVQVFLCVCPLCVSNCSATHFSRFPHCEESTFWHCQPECTLTWIGLDLFTWTSQCAGEVKGHISRCPQLERAHTNSNRIILLRNWGPGFLDLPLQVEQKHFMTECKSVTNRSKLWQIAIGLKWKTGHFPAEPDRVQIFFLCCEPLLEPWVSRTNAFGKPELLKNY